MRQKFEQEKCVAREIVKCHFIINTLTESSSPVFHYSLFIQSRLGVRNSDSNLPLWNIYQPWLQKFLIVTYHEIFALVTSMKTFIYFKTESRLVSGTSFVIIKTIIAK